MQSNLDEQPVGGGSQKGPSMDEFGAPETSKAADNTGPLEERIVSKNWQVRAAAFDELAQQFKSADSPFAEAFREHSASWKKYLGDANPGSLEKCLDALNIFEDRADPKLVGSCQNDIIKILIEKCIGHAKPTIKHKGLECFNLLFEVTESFDDSIETMCECLNSKNQKVSTSALIALNSWLSNYGVKKVKVKNFFQIVETASSSQFPAVRSEAMNFYKETYKWLGDEGIKPLIANLKKQQMDDLQKDFEELKDKPKNLRMTRSEKVKQKDAALDEIIKKESEESKEDVVFDMFDPVDVLSKYDAAWADKISELKAWKEKKDALEELLKDSDVPKIKPGDFSNVSRILKKLIGDSNVVVSQTAVKCCNNLAKGMRKDFEPCCKELAPPLIQKFKEKKTQLIDEINQVLDNFMLCTNLENLKDELIAGLQDKAPTVKKNLCGFIEKTAQKTYIDVLQRASGDFLSIFTKMSDDPDGDVRNAALQCLGIFKGRLGESAMSKFLQDLNPQKLQKVNESAQTVQPSKYDRPEKVEKKPEEKAPAPKGGAAKGKPAAKPQLKKEESKKEPQAQPKDEPMVIDEQPVGGGNNDEQPLGGGGGFEDKPIGGGAKGGYNLDNLGDDAFPDGNKGGMAFDDKPIGGGKKMGGFGGAHEEKPLGGGGGYNLDMLGDEAFGGGPPGGGDVLVMENKPKRAPPARFAAKKQQPEEEKQEAVAQSDDVIMNDDAIMEPKKQPPKKPPAKAAPKEDDSTKSKPPVAKAGPTKAPTGPQIQEENLGEGLSKEEAEAKVNEVFGSEIASKFDEAKWQDKQEGFKQLGEQLTQMSPDQVTLEAVAKFVRSKMKDWKESNINLIKEAIALFTLIQQNCEKVGKRTVFCIMPFLSDKLGDVKHVATISELLLGLSEIVTPKYVALQIIKYAAQAKSPNVLKESCNILCRMTDEFGGVTMPLKEVIDYANVAVNHSNPQVRTSAMALFSMLFKHIGEPIKNFLKDIKESTMKIILEEFDKTTPYKKGEYQKKRGYRGEAAAEEAAASGPGKKGAAGGGAGGAGGIDDLLGPRADISKQLTPKLIGMFKDKDWKVRQEAAQKVEEILKTSNMRIQATGLTELMDNLKQRMADPNKAALKTFINLMGSVVEALGTNAKQFTKKLLPPLLQCLADKDTLVRSTTNAAVEKWSATVGPEVIISIGGPMVSQDNPEMRTEMLRWIIKNNEAIRQSEVKELVKPFVQCLSDKTPAIRSMAEEATGYVMVITGYQAFQPVIKDLLPAVQNSIKPVIEKIKAKVGANAGPSGAPAQEAMNSSLGKSQQAQPAPQQQQQMQQQQQQPPALQKQNSLKPQIKAKIGAPALQQQQQQPEMVPQPKLNQSVMQPTLKQKENQTPVQAKGSEKRSESKDAVPRLKGMANTITGFNKQQQEPLDGLVVNFGYKEKRAQYDTRTKFQLEEIKGDQLDKLKTFTTQSMGQAFCQKLYSNDFKQHCDCVDQFNNLMGTQPDALKEILDLIFKWALVKMSESQVNTKYAISVLDHLAQLLQFLEDSQYFLWDFEAAVLIPLLCEKSGQNNNILKEKVRRLFPLVYNVYDKQKCYNMIVQYGLNSKNLRAQAECLDELAEFIVKHGIDYSSEKEMKLVAKMADHQDKSIRENALKFMGEAYKLINENIWSVIGEVTPKVKGLLEGRFKNLKKGLAGSSSQSNFFKPDSNLGMSSGGLAREQSPKPQNRVENPKVGALKKLGQSTSNLMGQNNANATPRSNLGGLKGLQNSLGGKFQDHQQNSGQSSLSKSINQFNSSNRSNEESKKNSQQSSASQGSKKQDMLKKVMSQDQSMTAPSGIKRPIPQTQRPEMGGGSGSHEFVGRGSEPATQVVNKNSFAGYKQTAVTKNTQVFPQQYQGDEDDEELRGILTGSDRNFGGDLEEEKKAEEVTKHIHQLKYADLSKRVDSLVSLNDMISQIEENKKVLVRSANDLVGAFTHVLNDIFDKNIEDIPLRFAKYFITIVLKTCSCKEIMREVSEERIFDLAEQLLTRLLIENLDKVGDNKEGELILKNLNSSMLRLLENCNHTYIFCVLFNLLRKYKDYPLMPKLPNLIIKCLLKLSKILEKLIDKLDIEKILLAIHEYLVVINHDNKTQNDEMGIRIVKTVTNELVKLKRDAIWEAYRVIQCHSQPDNHIYRWIQIILKSLQTQGSTPSAGSSASTAVNSEAEIKAIVEELRNPEKFESAIPKLHRFLEQNPQIDVNEYLTECSKTFQTFIKNNLAKYRDSQPSSKEESKQDYGGGDFSDGMMNSMKSTSNSDTAAGGQQNPSLEADQHKQPQSVTGPQNRISEYQSKLQSIKQRNQKSGAETTTNRDAHQNQQPHQLNTSFSAMNSSLSQKWHEINKKSANTKREGLQTAGVQQMSNTMTGFSGGGAGGLNSNNLESKLATQPPQMNQSIGSSGGDQATGGATNQDLNRRLAEMKAKLQALKKK